LCANNDDSSEDIDSDSSYEEKVNDFILMAMGYIYDKHTRGDMDEEEVVVDMEGELISALEEIDRLSCKKRKQKQWLMQFKMNGKKPDEDFDLRKVELEESKKIEDILKQQLSEKKARCEALEEEIVKTKKEMEKFKALYHQNLSSIKASEGLTSILNQKRNPKLKAGLGYEEGSSSEHPSNTKPIKFVKSTIIDNNHSAKTKKENQPPRRNERKCTRTESVDQRNYQHGRNRPAQRGQSFSRYKRFLYGYCFFCSNFGHKAITCLLRFRYEKSIYLRNNYLPQQRLRHASNKQLETINHVMARRRTQVKHNKIYEHNNRYDMLFSEPKCYVCHNYGHKATNCRLRNYKPDLSPTAEKFKVWKKKEDDKCKLVLSSQIQKNPWCIDSGFSKHMIGDKIKFLTLSESKSENVTFGNDALEKIKGKGTVSLSNGKGKVQAVLFVDGLKHNVNSQNSTIILVRFYGG
jgi:hypothetical protein